MLVELGHDQVMRRLPAQLIKIFTPPGGNMCALEKNCLRCSIILQQMLGLEHMWRGAPHEIQTGK